MCHAFTTLLYAALAFSLLLQAPARACPGDCDSDGTVTVAELVSAVSMALGRSPLDCDHLDTDGDGIPSVAELIAAVGSTMSGCPTATVTMPAASHTPTTKSTSTPAATATPTVQTSTPTPVESATAAAGCTILLSPSEINLPGCRPVEGDLRGAFQLAVSDENCCWSIASSAGHTETDPAEGCGSTIVQFNVPQNPFPRPLSEQIVAQIGPAGDIDLLSIRQSRSCTKTPSPGPTKTRTPAK